jgi:hypothetical protein
MLQIDSYNVVRGARSRTMPAGETDAFGPKQWSEKIAPKQNKHGCGCVHGSVLLCAVCCVLCALMLAHKAIRTSPYRTFVLSSHSTISTTLPEPALKTVRRTTR